MGGRGEERTGEVIDTTTSDVMAENNTPYNLHLLLLTREGRRIPLNTKCYLDK